MNTKRLADIIADPTTLAELRKCTSVSELVACLNKGGAACTREEGLRLLRTWESVAADEEEREELRPTPPGGLVGFLETILRRGAPEKRRMTRGAGRRPVTLEKVLEQMNK